MVDAEGEWKEEMVIERRNKGMVIVEEKERKSKGEKRVIERRGRGLVKKRGKERKGMEKKGGKR